MAPLNQKSLARRLLFDTSMHFACFSSLLAVILLRSLLQLCRDLNQCQRYRGDPVTLSILCKRRCSPLFSFNFKTQHTFRLSSVAANTLRSFLRPCESRDTILYKEVHRARERNEIAVVSRVCSIYFLLRQTIEATIKTNLMKIQKKNS